MPCSVADWSCYRNGVMPLNFASACGYQSKVLLKCVVFTLHSPFFFSCLSCVTIVRVWCLLPISVTSSETVILMTGSLLCYCIRLYALYRPGLIWIFPARQCSSLSLSMCGWCLLISVVWWCAYVDIQVELLRDGRADDHANVIRYYCTVSVTRCEQIHCVSKNLFFSWQFITHSVHFSHVFFSC